MYTKLNPIDFPSMEIYWRLLSCQQSIHLFLASLSSERAEAEEDIGADPQSNLFAGDAGKAAFAVTPFHIEANQKEEAEASQSVKEAVEAAEAAASDENSEELESKSKKHKKKKKKKGKEKEKDFEEQVAEAMKKQASDEAKPIDERKRGYNSMYDAKAPTEAEMEAYYRKRERYEDPMKNF